MEKVLIGASGEVTLPSEVLQKLDLRPGDTLRLSIRRGGLLLSPLPRDYIEHTYGLARDMWVAVGGSTEFVRETEESWRT
jgi:antitoxin component of MazEF toxin-antitoxin module